jgi:hypothetical protein
MVMRKNDPFAAADEAHELVAASELPSEVRKRISLILEEMGSGGARQVEVARELIAHFEDGLSAGLSENDLLHRFGDEATAARLIARQKRHPAHLELILGRGDSPISTLLRNVGYAARRLRQSPGFTVTAVFSLALGIGANVAIFSLVNAVLLRQPPLDEPEELVMIYTSTPRQAHGLFAYPDFEDLRDGTRETFAGLAASTTTMGQVDREGSVETILGEVVSGTHFDLLGIDAALGRTFTAEDDVHPGAHPVVMISQPV